MQNLFSSLGISPLDFFQIAAGFLLVMALIFGDKSRRRFWTNVMHSVFTFQCLLIIVFNDGLMPKFFAALVLFSTVIIRVVLARKNDHVSNRLNA